MSTKVIFGRAEVFVLPEVGLPRRPHAEVEQINIKLRQNGLKFHSFGRDLKHVSPSTDAE